MKKRVVGADNRRCVFTSVKVPKSMVYRRSRGHRSATRKHIYPPLSHIPIQSSVHPLAACPSHRLVRVRVLHDRAYRGWLGQPKRVSANLSSNRATATHERWALRCVCIVRTWQ